MNGRKLSPEISSRLREWQWNYLADSRSRVWSICRRFVVVEMTHGNVRHDRARVPFPSKATLAVGSVAAAVDVAAGTAVAAAVARPEKFLAESRRWASEFVAFATSAV